MAQENSPFSTEALGLDAIAGRLDNPKLLMDQVGVILLSASMLAFEEKQFGDRVWPAQYENQPAPWIHKAGVASDLAKGEGIKATRYGPTNATLQDSGNLRDSLAIKSSARFEVQVGSTVPYAKFHQWGSDLVGPAVQPVTSSMRRRLREEYNKADEGNKEALGRMFHYFRKDSISTHIRQRPFIGITDEIEEQIRSAVELFVETGRLQ